MKVFISWSGSQSKSLAEVFKKWLPSAINAIEPYFSQDDISKGTRWDTEIAKELEASKVGLILLNRNNLEAPWIMFEAGALSKNIDKSKVCPVLFGIEPSDVIGPLARFQATRFEENEIKRLLAMINHELGEDALSDDILETIFEVWWPKLEEKIREMLKKDEKDSDSTLRTERDILEEILNISRSLTIPSENILQELKKLSTSIDDNISKKSGPVFDRTQNDAQEKMKLDQDTLSDDDFEEESALAVVDWLTSKEITVRSYKQYDGTDNILNELSLFLGERFRTLANLHNVIRKSLSSGIGFSLNLSSKSPIEIANATQFCSKLSHYALLATYRYNRYTKTIHAAPQRNGKVINFFNGGWFERYIYFKFISLLSQYDIEYTTLIDPQVTFSNGDDFELDLLFLIDNRPLWIECKTGDNKTYISKHSEIRKRLLIPMERALLVILDVPDNLTNELSRLHNINVANQNNFLEKICQALDISDYTDIQQSFPQKNIYYGNLQSLLKKQRLRPFPEFRMGVINSLIKLVDTSESLLTLQEIKPKLAENLPISKNQLQDILNVILRSECLIGEDDKIVKSFSSNIKKLISSDSKVINNKCIEFYARSILCFDSNYFNDETNRIEFEKIMGDTVPDILMIDSFEEENNVNDDE